MFVIIPIACAVLLALAVVFGWLRRRRLREKYAFLWMALGLVTSTAGILSLTHTPATARVSGWIMVTFSAVLLFLIVSIVQLSWETSHLEEETRILAEEIALIRAERHQGERAR